MAECKDIDTAIANLSRKVDSQNQKIRDLERKQKECCDKINKPKDDSTDLSAILKRIQKIEKDILDLGGVIKTVIDDLKDLLDAATEHSQTANSAQGIFSAIIDYFVNE